MQDISAFLKENIARLGQKSPKFFKVWNTINSIALLIAGIPTILTYLDISSLNDILPGNGAKIALKVIAFASGWGLVMNKLTVQNSHEVVSDNGTLVQKPCADLPYTEKKEDSKIIEPKKV